MAKLVDQGGEVITWKNSWDGERLASRNLR
jgi:hypothetical protein